MPRTKRIDERALHETKGKLPPSLDMLNIKGPKFLFELVPVCSRCVLIHLFHSLLLPWTLLVGAQLVTAAKNHRPVYRHVEHNVTHRCSSTAFARSFSFAILMASVHNATALFHLASRTAFRTDS